MNTPTDRIAENFPEKEYIYLTTTDEVSQVVDKLENIISDLKGLTAFPEGAHGVLLYALLRHVAESCPDVDDFNYRCQGLKAVLDVCFEDIAENTPWF